MNGFKAVKERKLTADIKFNRMKIRLFEIACFWFPFMLIIACKEEATPLSIEPLHEFEEIDTSLIVDKKFRKNKEDIYLLNAFTKHRAMRFFTDSIVNLTKEIDKYDNYTISFYKPSDKTSTENLEENPKDFYNYSKLHDLVLVYKWNKGKYVGVDMVDNGKIIDTTIKTSIKDVYKVN